MSTVAHAVFIITEASFILFLTSVSADVRDTFFIFLRKKPETFVLKSSGDGKAEGAGAGRLPGRHPGSAAFLL